MEEKKQDTVKENRKQVAGKENGAGQASEASRRGRSRRQPPEERKKNGSVRPKVFAALGAVVALAAVSGGAFFYRQVQKYEECFLPGTVINEMDMSDKTVEQVKEEIMSGLDGYVLTIRERGGNEETISGEAIGLRAEFDGSLEALLEDQNPMDWWKRKWNPAQDNGADGSGGSGQEESGSDESGQEGNGSGKGSQDGADDGSGGIWIETMLAYDEELFSRAVKELDCMDEASMIPPEDARISEYQPETKSYEIIPAVQGTTLVLENVEQAVSEAVLSLSSEVDLEEKQCYTKPAVDTEDERLVSLAAQMNQYVGAVVTHTFGSSQEVLDGDTIHQWIVTDGTTASIDESQAAAYVKALAKTYDTAYQTKTLKTSYGKTVKITKGNYGWRMNQAAETAAILEIIRNGEQQTREPEYSQKAASHDGNDYGDTYVEINLTAQHLFFYKNGKLLVESDFVSGNESRGWATPSGAYPLTYKERNATLKGEGYATPVSYWMPFNGGIGMHDASWRGSFGGTIYKTNGSHGCINLPPAVAKTIYENISAGMPVLCYHLEGTEAGAGTNTGAGTDSSAAETTAAETTAAETTAGESAGETAAESQAETETPVSETAPAQTNAPGPGGTETGSAETPPFGPVAGETTPAADVPETASPSGEVPPVGPGMPESGSMVGPGGVDPGPSDTPDMSGGDEEGVGPGFSDAL